VLGPDRGSGFPTRAYYRQSIAGDLGAMAQRVRAKYLTRIIQRGAVRPRGAADQGVIFRGVDDASIGV
jgi:hypothetical protein